MVGYDIMNSSKSTKGDNGVIYLKLKRPDLFQFEAGHHCKLKIVQIDPTWHPFSLASSPDSEILEFFIKVNGKGSWTYKLLQLFVSRNGKDDELEPFIVEIMGPSGSPIANQSSYHSDALVIGSGTGFVASLSLLQQHVMRCVAMNPSMYISQREQHWKRVNGISDAMHDRKRLSNINDGEYSGSSKMASSEDRYKNAQKAERNVFYHISAFLGFAIGVLSLALTVSWNNLPYQVSRHLDTVLMTGTCIFQVSFLVLIYTRQIIPSFGFFIDVAFVLSGLVGDWYWISHKGLGSLNSSDQIIYFVWMSYVIGRFWYEICSEIYLNPLSIVNHKQTNVFDNVWIERSPDIIMKAFPIYEKLWNALEDAWGTELTNEAFNIHIYCTGMRDGGLTDLHSMISNSRLNIQEDVLIPGRPSFPDILKRHSLLLNTNKDTSSTVLSFCGSEVLASFVSEAKVLHDIWLASIGMLQHHYEIQLHSYGGLFNTRKSAKKAQSGKHTQPTNSTTDPGGNEDNFALARSIMWQSPILRELDMLKDEELGSNYHNNTHIRHLRHTRRELERKFWSKQRSVLNGTSDHWDDGNGEGEKTAESNNFFNELFSGQNVRKDKSIFGRKYLIGKTVRIVLYHIHGF